MKITLKQGALGLLDAFTMAVAGSAPAYSITVSTAALFAAVGIAGPAALWIALIPMTGIAVAFFYLNRWRSDAGAAYAWAGRAIHPALGFMAGWSLLASSTIFMVAAAVPAAQATLDLVAPGRTGDVLWATGLGAVWFLGVLALVTIGISAAARVQTVLTLFELAVLALIGVLVIWNMRAAPAAAFSWRWFAPSALGSFDAFSAGMVVSVFLFLGWDVSANLAEETENPHLKAGLGGVIGVVAIFLLFALLQVAAQMALTPADMEANSANLLPLLGRIALPGIWSALAIVAVLISAIATLETQLLQCTRLLFSMARDGVISKTMGELHPRFRTPWLAGFAVGGVSLLLFAASATAPTINQIMSDLINAVGVQVSFYYAIAGFACAWYYRKAMRSDWRMLMLAGLFPLLSAVFVGAIGLYQLPHLGWRVAAISVGTILIGLAPLWHYRRAHRSSFYTDPAERADGAL